MLYSVIVVAVLQALKMHITKLEEEIALLNKKLEEKAQELHRLHEILTQSATAIQASLQASLRIVVLGNSKLQSFLINSIVNLSAGESQNVCLSQNIGIQTSGRGRGG